MKIRSENYKGIVFMSKNEIQIESEALASISWIRNMICFYQLRDTFNFQINKNWFRHLDHLDTFPGTIFYMV